MDEKIRFFIAGIIQGSLPDSIHPQEYRRMIAEIIAERFPRAEIFDPVEKYPDSLGFDAVTARAAFFDLMALAGGHDVLIAFVPEASMGTAIELWNAHNAGSVVVCVSRLSENWAVRFLSDRIVPDWDGLKELVRSGELAGMIRERLRGK